MKSIFPKEVIEKTVEVHQFKHRHVGKIIYTVILLGIVFTFTALPFINVTVYTSSSGIIKPKSERVPLNLINSGKIAYKNLRNNQPVKKGDTLLILENKQAEEQLHLYQSQLTLNRQFVHDLTLLTQKTNRSIDSITSAKYRTAYIEYQQKIAELTTQLRQSQKDENRHKQLYGKNVISKSEYETKKLAYDINVANLQNYRKQQQTQWQSELITIKNTLMELESNKNQLTANNGGYILTAPINGTLLNILGIETGSNIAAGATIAEISPDGDLIVESYISSSDIGLIKEAKEVFYQIEAYNYNQWGTASGEIIDIGNDIQLVDNRPAFKVRSTIDQKHLSLKNGFKGYLSKGMVLTSTFKLTERSLFNLLYDKVDDWLNPSRLNEVTVEN
ncbi:HlyD family secretion protein [Leptobacterium sp. I13]|uniref:HlyD family secretion protein n=1 Tax=Leptobacterium meishanense TaxID=3128904 RepID=UPI0030EBE334